jgi:hypothetical protein
MGSTGRREAIGDCRRCGGNANRTGRIFVNRQDAVIGEGFQTAKTPFGTTSIF